MGRMKWLPPSDKLQGEAGRGNQKISMAGGGTQLSLGNGRNHPRLFEVLEGIAEGMMEEAGAEQRCSLRAGQDGEPAQQPNPSRPRTLKSLMAFKVPLVSPKCTFMGILEGKALQGVCFSSSSGLELMAPVKKTLLIHLGGSVHGFLLLKMCTPK